MMKRSMLLAIVGLACVGFVIEASGQASGWIKAFNGTNLDGWNRVGEVDWKVVNGAIEATSGDGFLVSKDPYGDFELRAEFWADGNSGIFIRCADGQRPGAARCYEVNIFDKRPDQ